MKQSEYDELVKATLGNCAGEYLPNIWVVPLSKELMTVIECGLEQLKKTIKSQ